LNDLDNAIPLCYNCHGLVESYNINHPKGNKFKRKELKLRREQIYEEFTRHLIPPIFYEITQVLSNEKKREFPDVGFTLKHCGNSLPVKVKTILKIVGNGKNANLIDFSSGHYSGDKLWNLNPYFTIFGHFSIPKEHVDNAPLKIRISTCIIDQYEREHFYLPFEYVYVKEGSYWYAEP